MNVDLNLTSQQLRLGAPTIELKVEELGVRQVVDIDFHTLVGEIGRAHSLAFDLLILSAITYVLDKSVPRRVASDAWTRQFALQLPVSDPDAWTHHASVVEDILSFLTGDSWEISFSKGVLPITVPKEGAPKEKAVSLFSGGADSLAGVVDYVSSSPPADLLLLGHYDGGNVRHDQRNVLLGLSNGLGQSAPRLSSIRVRPLPSNLSAIGALPLSRWGRENTLRSRSLVFLALGAYAANCMADEAPLLVPENGFIALNPPLTTARLGSCSTRTTHPYFMTKVQDLLGGLGLKTRILTPLSSRTKGEVFASSRNPGLLWPLLPVTVSCAHPTRRMNWRRIDKNNCGYCYPCLIRRAAFHAINQDDGNTYGIDVLKEVAFSDYVAGDFRALVDRVAYGSSRSLCEEAVMASGPLSESLPAMAELASRGFAEIRRWLEDKWSHWHQFTGGPK